MFSFQGTSSKSIPQIPQSPVSLCYRVFAPLRYCFSSQIKTHFVGLLICFTREFLLKKFNEASSYEGTSVNFLWWRVPGSNRWPPACKAGALPAELTPHIRSGGPGLAFLRESHGGCNSPPDCCQEPPFESILACSPLELNRPGLGSL